MVHHAPQHVTVLEGFGALIEIESGKHVSYRRGKRAHVSEQALANRIVRLRDHRQGKRGSRIEGQAESGVDEVVYDVFGVVLVLNKACKKSESLT